LGAKWWANSPSRRCPPSAFQQRICPPYGAAVVKSSKSHPHLRFARGILQRHEYRAFHRDLVEEVLETEHAVAAADDVGVHRVVEDPPVARLLHIEEFIEPAPHHGARRLQARQDARWRAQELEVRVIVERPADRHLDQRSFLAETVGLAELGTIA